MENQTSDFETLPIIEQQRFPISIAVILGLQIGAIFLAAWFIAYDKAAGGFSSLAGLLIIPLGILGFPLLGIVGLAQAIRLLRKKLHTIPAIVLILTSVLMLTLVVPSSIASKLSPFFSSTAEKEDTKSIVEKRQAYSNTKETHYAILSEIFQKPQKIIEAQYQYLVLDNGNVLKLFGFYSSHENTTEFENYARKFLVGKTIKIDLPNYADFSNSYIPNSRTGTFANNNYEWPQDSEFNERYGEIPVLIYIDSDLINSKYGKGSAIQKYQ
ncbi:hypothetical protein A2641_01075 [Candidatus Nomurabacteria bacterium RIFCSPHIGHO2_01_FULL_37_25]|uniref:Uncharacterized protein n=1 Tax=Candidatus Nomurabacteria bacterium RIFCSPLOWO2_01_FULL_36_16 TaxID=1801767 RepID=A0A1F6WYV6_9BACT|nr:MAG: hypothetical protein A2641_01075 [Candidatus Nomurabacteria bacterium RIFCSPHIGHO2_01_FULL_37_25]OGI75311.1 MAG: hypothetical protein A3D36_01975 [Candidatus Nomurabacteria bacterium RIFCSPHIGHO2_02_FULL_36_29]OGI87058.1 MAG: hypothetical protein A3A91_00070 [Candidatus Nomurabacteria bacterium RIFCSPLOWO2_01_FULL_36_16]OGI95923.1 MAG: hypothetical protein A3I84_01220 [Candidatus Nomurabacteria bacterium RIFCSPLOWO2_02_FULL_36_8]